MNNGNIIYSFIGGLIVALAWLASVVMTMQSLLVGLGTYTIAAALIIVIQDYNQRSKSSR